MGLGDHQIAGLNECLDGGGSTPALEHRAGACCAAEEEDNEVSF